MLLFGLAMMLMMLMMLWMLESKVDEAKAKVTEEARMTEAEIRAIKAENVAIKIMNATVETIVMIRIAEMETWSDALEAAAMEVRASATCMKIWGGVRRRLI